MPEGDSKVLRQYPRKVNSQFTSANRSRNDSHHTKLCLLLLLQERPNCIPGVEEEAFITAQHSTAQPSPSTVDLGQICNSWRYRLLSHQHWAGTALSYLFPKAGKLHTSPFFVITILENRPSPVRRRVKQLPGGCV